MREFIKGTCALTIVVAVFALMFVLLIDVPVPHRGIVALGLAAALAVGFGGFLGLHFQRDRVPDYLSRLSRKFFEREGFCFLIVPVAIGEQCVLSIYFQSRRSQPSQARLIIRPTRGFLRTADMQALDVRIECPEAGFGVMRLPLAVPAAYQGTRQPFDVWASVTYPAGKGRMLRYRDGLAVGAAPNSPWRGPLLTVAGAAMGMLVIPGHPARMTLSLPANVVEDVPMETAIGSEVIWKLGDPPLAEEAAKVAAVSSHLAAGVRGE